MTHNNGWTKHQQLFWQMQSGNPTLPLWLRATAYAYGLHRRNGHAPLGTGQLVLVLATVDRATGVIHQPRSDSVSDAIGDAVRYGFLSAESCARCLVVPEYAVSGGLVGRTDETCRQPHSRRLVT